MSESKDGRTAAIQAAKDRMAPAEVQRAAAERDRREADAQRMDNLMRWGNVSLSHTVAGTILATVTVLGQEVAREHSPILFRFPPQAAQSSVLFELHQSGQLEALARLLFSLTSKGYVEVSCSLAGVNLPAPMPVGDCTPTVVEGIANRVLEAALAMLGR